MNLYILRHAIAEEKSAKWRDDSKRPLTAKGEKRMAEAARGMKAMGLEFDLILSSPFVRAKDTAKIVADVFEQKVEYSAHLKSEGKAEKLVQQLNSEFQAKENALLVGHEPYLSRLVGLLCSGSEELTLTLKKGGLCKLSVAKLRPGKCAALEWLLTPRQMRQFRG